MCFLLEPLSRKEPFKHPYFRFAHEGETDVLVKSRKPKGRTKLDLSKDAVLFKGLKKSQVAKIVEQSKIQKLKPGAVVFSKNETGNDFFMI